VSGGDAVPGDPKAALTASIKLAPGELERSLAAEPAETFETKSAIVAVRRPGTVASLPPGLLPETPEEHRRRADAADALFRDMVRRIAAKDRAGKRGRERS
jgi:hypothetical protein